MSCFGCSKKYGLFCKEHGCPNCGYSYCAKCLKRPVAVPRHNGKVLNVCLICYDKLSKQQQPEKVIDCEALPGTILTKSTRIGQFSSGDLNAAFDNLNSLLDSEPAMAKVGEILKPITETKLTACSHSNTEDSDVTENLDRTITKRLRNLKVAENASADDEIRSRLANLNGVPQKNYSQQNILLSTDQRSDQEKMDDLLVQFVNETQLDQRVQGARKDAISDIEQRLKALRDTPMETVASKNISSEANTTSDNEEDEEAVLKDVIEKYLAESRLPESSDVETELASSIPLPPNGKRQADLEELPWCNICNEDAVYRCKGCDGELFCAQCYRECHDDDEEYRVHVKENYAAPPRFKEDHF